MHQHWDVILQADAAFEKMLVHSYTMNSVLDYHNTGDKLAEFAYSYCKLVYDLFSFDGNTEMAGQYQLRMLIATQLRNMHLNKESPNQL